jgi:hypothetical protein
VDWRPSKGVEVEGQAAGAKGVDRTLATRSLQTREKYAFPAGIRPSGKRLVIEDPPPTDKVIELHKGLHKAESALLVQARTKKIRLAEFLYAQGVPGIDTAMCRCGAGRETPLCMALFCTEEAGRRRELTDYTGKKWTYPQLIRSWEAVRSFAKG